MADLKTTRPTLERRLKAGRDGERYPSLESLDEAGQGKEPRAGALGAFMQLTIAVGQSCSPSSAMGSPEWLSCAQRAGKPSKPRWSGRLTPVNWPPDRVLGNDDRASHARE